MRTVALCMKLLSEAEAANCIVLVLLLAAAAGSSRRLVPAVRLSVSIYMSKVFTCGCHDAGLLVHLRNGPVLGLVCPSAQLDRTRTA